MLRVAFPVAVFTEEANFDIQYGTVRRPTHRNTSWDAARFEVCGQKFADLSEEFYGAALLNDCKYGYKVFGTTLDLCLLRAPKFPDWDADQGHHEFIYSFLPHTGSLNNSGVRSEAAKLNRPALAVPGRSRLAAFARGRDGRAHRRQEGREGGLPRHPPCRAGRAEFAGGPDRSGREAVGRDQSAGVDER